MASKNDVRAALRGHDEQIEEQSIELRRLRRQVELSVRRTADLQAVVDRLQLTVERAERVAAEIEFSPKRLQAKRARDGSKKADTSLVLQHTGQTFRSDVDAVKSG